MGFLRTALIAGAALLAASLFFGDKGNTEYSNQGDYSHKAGRCQCAICERDRERQAAQRASLPRSPYAARPPSSLDKLSPLPNTSRYGSPKQSAYATTGSQYRDDLDTVRAYRCACGQFHYSQQSYGDSDDDQGTDGQRFSFLSHRSSPTEFHSDTQFSSSPALAEEDRHESSSDDWDETADEATDDEPIFQYEDSDDDQGTNVQQRNVAERFQRCLSFSHRSLSTESHSNIRLSSSPALAEEDQHESYSDDWDETAGEATDDEPIFQYGDSDDDQGANGQCCLSLSHRSLSIESHSNSWFSSSPALAEEDQHQYYGDGWDETADEATDGELIFQKLSVPRQSTAESLLDSSHPAIRHPSSPSKVTLNSTTVGIPTTQRHREQKSAPKPDSIHLRRQHEHEEPVSEESSSPDDSEDPQALRARAKLKHKKMIACFRKRDHANKIRDRVLSRHWSKMGRRHQDEMKKLNFKACTLIFETNNANQKAGTIDLHRLFIKEAIERTREAISKAKFQGDTVLRFIVGKGLHARDRVPKMRLALEDEMQRQSLRAEIDTRNRGVLIVYLG